MKDQHSKQITVQQQAVWYETLRKIESTFLSVCLETIRPYVLLSHVEPFPDQMHSSLPERVNTGQGFMLHPLFVRCSNLVREMTVLKFSRAV